MNVASNIQKFFKRDKMELITNQNDYNIFIYSAYLITFTSLLILIIYSIIKYRKYKHILIKTLNKSNKNDT